SNNSWADGVVFVSQCPIAVSTSFLYTSPTVIGTFWYHSHRRTQYCDGLIFFLVVNIAVLNDPPSLKGPIVVYDPDDPHLDLY
ncbi:hypothetical protein C8R44DRAFT_566225, partial [Mycena epipterygia]